MALVKGTHKGVEQINIYVIKHNFIQLLTAVLIQAEDRRLLSSFYLHD